VRFLVDANVSPRVAALLAAAGHDAVAVRDVRLAAAADDDILAQAFDEDRVIISHDTDFGTLLAARRQVKPSFILVRSSDPLTADDVAGLLLANLDAVTDDLAAGAIVTFARSRLRVRRLALDDASRPP
jgi:predicted nuclease of predicted toxin-antitoxin system